MVTLRSKREHPQARSDLDQEAQAHADARVDPAHQAGGEEADRHADAAAADHLAHQRVGKARRAAAAAAAAAPSGVKLSMP